MTHADNTRYLTRAAASRRQATLTRARNAIEHLDRTGQPITFSAVAAAAGVSRTWLYRNPAIRDLITRLRSQPTLTPTTRAAHRATAESLRTRLGAARQEITRLRAENAALRAQAAHRLGQQRAQQSGTPADPAGRPELHVSYMSTTQKPLLSKTFRSPARDNRRYDRRLRRQMTAFIASRMVDLRPAEDSSHW